MSLGWDHLAAECDNAVIKCQWCGKRGHEWRECPGMQRIRLSQIVQPIERIAYRTNWWTVLIVFVCGLVCGLVIQAWGR